MNDTDDVVDIVTVDGEPRMLAGRNRFLDAGVIVVQIDSDDFRHDADYDDDLYYDYY